MKNQLKNIGMILMVVLLASCKDFLNIAAPTHELAAESVFQNPSTANAAIAGIYSRMMEPNIFIGGSSNLTVICGLSADEFTNYSAGETLEQFANNSLIPTNGNIDSFWSQPYQYIYSANVAIESLSKESKIPITLNKQLLGEAKFIRAFCYFYLVNLFGDVPYNPSSDYKVNSLAPRTSKEVINRHIEQDLIEAKALLSADYSFSNKERIRPNKYAATALLARLYLYTGNWKAAEKESTEIIQNTSLYDLQSVSLNEAFLKNSRESIWQLMPVKPGYNTDEGRYLILTQKPTIAALTDDLYNSFEVDDPRKNIWVQQINVDGQLYQYPFKYKIKSGNILSEYYTVFRLAEQYLIRAEARAQLNDLSTAVQDINSIRKRARGTSTSALLDLLNTMSKAEVLTAIAKERRSELFAEWGHRWMDLKRTNQADLTLAPLKGDTWEITDILYPIPQTQIINNPNTIQNPGYLK